MKSLFSETGLQVINSLSFARSLYAFDFDGTLAPISPNPASTAASATTLDLIRALAGLAPVLVVSGRSVRDLKRRIAIKGIHLIGNHGLEGVLSRKKSVDTARASRSKWIRQLASFGTLSSDPALRLEDKTFSLAIHYRSSRQKRRARAVILRAAEKLHPRPRVIPGKCVVNLVPAGAPHKGTALVEAMRHIGAEAAFYVGDDDTDEDVFSLPEGNIVTVRVGRRAGSRAQFFLQRQRDINRLLRRLVSLEEKRSHS